MTHPLAAYFITILNSLFLSFMYYNAKVNFIKINFKVVIIGAVIILLARGSFAGIDYRSVKEKRVFYPLLLLNVILWGFVFWEWKRV